MTNLEADIIRRYGSLREYVYSCLASYKPNTVKTRFDEFYRQMDILEQEGNSRSNSWELIADFYDIQEDTIDDYVLDAVLYSR